MKNRFLHVQKVLMCLPGSLFQRFLEWIARRVPETVSKPMPKQVSIYALVPLMLFLLAACATMPEAAQEDIVGWLPPDSDTVVRLVVPGNHYLAAMLLGPQMFETLEPVLDRLKILAAGLDYEKGSVHAVIQGRWPKAIAASALNKNMERQPGRPASWIDESGGKLVMVSGQIMIYSSDRAEEILTRMEAGEKWSPLVNPGTRLPEADFIMWSDDSVFSRGGAMPSLSLPRKSAAIIDSVVFVLDAAAEGRYDLGINIRSTQESYVRPITLMMRVVLMGLFGLSNDAGNRESHSRMKLDIVGDEVQIFIPSLSLEPIKKIIDPGLAENRMAKI